MFDTIYIGTSGLAGYSKGLRVVSNNLANVNTPGFKGSQLQFTDFFYEGSSSQQSSGGGNGAQLGTGLNTLATQINFAAGSSVDTKQDLDLEITGNGYFVVKDGQNQFYTRNGSFKFDGGVLVHNYGGLHVQGINASGEVGEISLANYKTSASKITSSIKLSGNLASDTAVGTAVTVSAVDVIDSMGFSHLVNLDFTKNAAPAVDTWTVTMKEGSTTIGSGTVQFSAGAILPSSSKVNIVFNPTDGTPFLVELDMSANVVSRPTAAGVTKIAFSSQDGYKEGLLTSATFDEAGVLKLAYDNGQKVDGPSLILASFDNADALEQKGGALFEAKVGNEVHLGRPKTKALGKIASGKLEGSNVDMALEFSNLIVMQRGYQASSRVVSTANEMIQELFDMKGRN